MSNVNQPSQPVTPAVNASAPVSKPTDTNKQPISSATTAPAAPKIPEELFDVQVDGKVEKRTRKEIVEAYQLRQLSDKKRSEAEKVLNEYKKLQEISKQDP